MAAIPCCVCCHPTKQPDDSYDPSCFTRTCFAPMFGAKVLPLPDKGTASGKILVVGTSKSKLSCTNGKVFNTGHNVSETLFPMYYLQHAGYTFDIATGDGKPFAFEDWSWAGPKASKNEAELRGVLESNVGGFMKPLTTEAALSNLKAGAYVAAFFPGGHGTMIEMHDPNHDGGAISQILAHLHEKAVPTITLCHGPNVLRAAPEGTYKGYTLFGFPDSADKQNAGPGYTPGMLKEWMGEELAKVGVTLMNKSVNSQVHTDREVISACGPPGAAMLGVEAVKMLAMKRK